MAYFTFSGTVSPTLPFRWAPVTWKSAVLLAVTFVWAVAGSVEPGAAGVPSGRSTSLIAGPVPGIPPPSGISIGLLLTLAKSSSFRALSSIISFSPSGA